MSNRISIRLSPELQRDLGALAKATGKNESQIVREALEAYCQKHGASPTCYDLARQAGLIGCARNLPADLSTNDRHLDGFGRG